MKDYMSEFLAELLDNIGEMKTAFRRFEKASYDLHSKNRSKNFNPAMYEKKALALLDLWITLSQELKETGEIIGDIRRITSQRHHYNMIQAKHLLEEVREIKSSLSKDEDDM